MDFSAKIMTQAKIALNLLDLGHLVMIKWPKSNWVSQSSQIWPKSAQAVWKLFNKTTNMIGRKTYYIQDCGAYSTA